MRVFVTRRIPEEGLSILGRRAEVRLWEGELPPPREILLKEIADADGVLALLTDRFDGEALARAAKLRVISNYAVGYDNVDVEAATRRGIMVTNTPGVLTETTADLAFALMLAVGRRIVQASSYARDGSWKTWHPTVMLGQDIHGATLGLLGLGRIGLAVARRARGFDMKVLYHGPRRKLEAERDLGLGYASFEELLSRSDFVSVHVPLTAETYKILDERAFRLMKPSAVLINTSRGAVVDERALYEALREGRIWGAGLDVTDPEPPSRDDPLFGMPNVVITPHIGSASYATRAKMAVIAATNLIDALEGRVVKNLVNPEVLTPSP